MSPEQIVTLIMSKNPDDVRIGLEFIGSFRLRDIRKMFPNGINFFKEHKISITLNCALESSVKVFRMHHGLYLGIWRNVITFSATPYDYETISYYKR